jgi:hypothetical protein
MKNLNIDKKSLKVAQGMLAGTQKKFVKLMNDINDGMSFQDFGKNHDISLMWIPGYEGKNIYRVKFDLRFRAFIQVADSTVTFVKLVPREGAY